MEQVLKGYINMMTGRFIANNIGAIFRKIRKNLKNLKIYAISY
ncbi:hypothetical protein T15_0705 [Streptococcus suis T15]|nr:hypothetical protein T15_0705 [Streptococcus suis T15]